MKSSSSSIFLPDFEGEDENEGEDEQVQLWICLSNADGAHSRAMAVEPINIYSHKQDPAGVAALLHQLAPGAKFIGTDDAWERITIEGAKSWFRKKPVTVFKHEPDYYRGPGWSEQIAGMQGFFEHFPDSPRKPDILRLIRSFRFALIAEFEPELALDSDDARLKFLFAVTKHLDGVILTTSALRDAAGRVLISAEAESDPAAVLPAIPSELDTKGKAAATAAAPPAAAEPAKPEKVKAPKPPKPAPKPVVVEPDNTPPARRVARRALCLAAVAGRGLLELESMPKDKAEARRKGLQAWTGELALEDELEPQELKLIQDAVGALDRQTAIDAAWRLEGLGVLVWALGKFEIPAYDQLVDAAALLPAVGFLDLNKATTLLAAPAVRPAEKLRQMRARCLTIHWRLQDFSLKKKKMNFRTFAKDCWFGPLDVSLARFHDHDLSIGEVAIGNAPKEAIERTLSSARERHLAANWLADGGEVYSKTDVST